MITLFFFGKAHCDSGEDDTAEISEGERYYEEYDDDEEC